MRDYQRTFSLYVNEYRKGCGHASPGGGCDRSGGCVCKTASEVAAITDALLPRGYTDKHLKDFSGDVPGGGTVLSPAAVKAARDTLVTYCWGESAVTVPNAVLDSPEGMRRSKLDLRREQGTSLVIHGDGLVGYTRPGDGERLSAPAVVRRPIGRTLLAAIAMREVVRRRLFPGHVGQTYEWVKFDLLRTRAASFDREAVGDYERCDWLVVDGISPMERVSDAQRGFVLEKVNAIFAERQAARLPSVLVFQFDVSAAVRDGSLADKVGGALAEMVADDATFRIRLSPDAASPPPAAAGGSEVRRRGRARE